jgi:glycosyltransferase involved in cell wall biosynthesis
MFTWPSAIKQYADLYEQLYANKHVGPKISVIIPCYNLAQYLTDAVTSVLQQSEQDFEVIIVNDASPDNTSEVARELALLDTRVSVINNPSNLYLAGALNTGIKAARGKYILPLDADNMIEHNTLRVLGNMLDQNADIDIAYGAVRFVLPDGITPDREVSPTGVSPWPRDFSFDNQMRHWNQCPSTSLYRKKVWERSGGYRTRCRTAEDADFWTRVSSLGFKPAKVTDAVTLVYRQREDSMSRVNKDWDWTAWFPWSRLNHLTPPGVNPQNISTYEPPLISVVIPVGPGHEDKVIDAVDSLVAQTFQKWECIVVNDTSNDFNWIHPFCTIINSGGDSSVNRVSHARNLGIKASNAKLFVLLDADDFLHPDALQEMYDAYKKWHGYIYTDWLVHEKDEVHITPEFDKSSVLQTMPHAVTCLYEKQQWLDVGGFDEDIPGWEDWDFLINITMHGYCGSRVAKPLLQYRMELGTVREDNYARQDELKAAIYTKWKEYIEGEKFPMSCGGCGQRVIPSAPQLTQAELISRAPLAQDGDWELIEFTGDSAPRTYLGQKSGNTYRFGGDREHRVRYVHKDDIENLLGRPEFRRYSEDMVALH